MHTSEKALEYFSKTGQIPLLDSLLAKNPYIRLRGVGLDWAATYCAGKLFGRYKELAELEKQGKKPEKERSDFLDYFIGLKREQPEVVDDFTVISYMVLNVSIFVPNLERAVTDVCRVKVLAGADTTAVTLRAIMYFLLKNPTAHKTLVSELDAAYLPSPVPYSKAANLPYLDAVLHESMRLYPAVAMLLERVVPETRLTLSDGRTIPAGTIVGMNPWVVGHCSEVWGEDLEAFKPERWLKGERETEKQFEERLQAMKAADLSFGAGNRVCIGRNMALVEMYKIIPTLLLKYKVCPALLTAFTWLLHADHASCGLNLRIPKRTGRSAASGWHSKGRSMYGCLVDDMPILVDSSHVPIDIHDHRYAVSDSKAQISVFLKGFLQLFNKSCFREPLFTVIDTCSLT